VNRNAKLASPYFLRLFHLYESDYGLCAEEHFQELLDLEMKRALRSKTLPLLLLLDFTGFEEKREGDRVLRNLAPVLFSCTREIDAKGWYRYPAVLGILMPDLIATSDSLLSTRNTMVDRLRTNLAKALGSLAVERIGFSCQTLPSPLEATRAADLTPDWQGQHTTPEVRSMS
jgi:hypothetical protein